MTDVISLDGEKLTIEQLVRIARDPSVNVVVADDAIARIQKSAELIQRMVREGKVVYGVTTGFGEFKRKVIPDVDDQKKLQQNLLRSHAAGVGENTDVNDLSNYYPPEIVRAALATRLNAFAKGNSGIREVLVHFIEAMLNRGVIPLVPLRGSVGASGDLCPLSHLFVTLLGEGRYYTLPDKTFPDVTLPVFLGFDPAEVMLQQKEGLALINGANFSSAMLSLGVHDARVLANTADVAAAITLEALCGRPEAFDPRVHAARRHEGQGIVARRMLALVAGSRLLKKTKDVQDAYSLRCVPQVHGASRDAIKYAAMVAEIEINSATDNPLFFPEEDNAYSAGNFHGQPVALAADFLTIAIAELANISERRTQMLLDHNHNRKLPPCLSSDPGLNSGLMIAQYTAASLVSENKVLSHPASVDSIPTSANTEDHVSMSTHAARKMRTVLGNAQSVIAIELLSAAQAADWRVVFDIDPEQSAPPAGADFARRVEGKSASIAQSLAPALRAPYLRIRKYVAPLTEDRMLSEDIRLIRESVANGELAGET